MMIIDKFLKIECMMNWQNCKIHHRSSVINILYREIDRITNHLAMMELHGETSSILYEKIETFKSAITLLEK